MPPRPGRVACVLGDMDLVRPLGLAGIRSAVVAPERDAIRRSRFVVDHIDWDDDWAHEDDLLERLLAYGRAQPALPVLFYQHDRQLLFVSRHRASLADAFRFVIAPEGLVEDLVDKVRFHGLAQRLGLPVPGTVLLRPSGGSSPPEGLSYPMVVKPSTRAEAAWGEVEPVRKAVPVDTAEEMERLWPRLVASGCDVVAQTTIPGPEERIESYHVYVDAVGSSVAEFTGRKLRTLPSTFGHTTSCVTTDAPDVVDIGRTVVERLGLTGLAKVDMKRAPDGSLGVLEVNPRFSLWHHLGAKAGVNLPALVWADLTGRSRPEVRSARPGVRWCSAGDRLAAREAGIPLVRWFGWALSCAARHNVSLDDPMVAVGRLIGRLSSDRP